MDFLLNLVNVVRVVVVEPDFLGNQAEEPDPPARLIKSG